MTRAFLRLATLGIVHAAVTVTLPKNASFLVEVMKLDGSSDTYKLPVCCDLRVAAADLCAVASQPEEALSSHCPSPRKSDAYGGGGSSPVTSAASQCQPSRLAPAPHFQSPQRRPR